ncbi:hypothetical protein GCM10020258_07850 [Sphingomonas yabuuchiae]
MRRLSLASLAPIVGAAALSGCIPAAPRPEAAPPVRQPPSRPARAAPGAGE